MDDIIEYNLIEHFVRLKITACFDLSECSDFESNQVINNLAALYLEHLGRQLEYIWFDYEEIRLRSRKKVKLMSETNEDLFSKFYNHEKILIANMSSDEFKAHEEELAKVAFEAKARLTAVVDKKREDNAKLRGSQKEWLMPRSGAEDALVSDAIAAVGQRKKRMNKIEKLNEQLAGFVDDETRKMLIANIERKSTDSGVNLISFVKTKTDESMVEDLKAKVEEKKESTPFDPSKLSGLFKKE